jgi:hypothetical protein
MTPLAFADRLALSDLAARLGLWLDEQRFDETADLFVPDTTVQTPGGAAHGVQALAEQARRNHAGFRTQHVITDVLADVDGDRAHLRANLTVTFAKPGADGALPVPVRTLGERYDLDAVRTGHGWRLSRVEVRPVWASS